MAAVTPTQIRQLERKLAGMSQEEACRELYGEWSTDQVCGAFANAGAEDRHFELLMGIEENEDNTASAAGLLVLCDFADEHGVEPELVTLTRTALKGQEQVTWERAGDKSYWTQEDAERQLPGWRHQFPDAEFRTRETTESGWIIEYLWHGAE